MELINRIARLFKADFHAVLDQIEEPEALLRQAIRDMEDELAVGLPDEHCRWYCECQEEQRQQYAQAAFVEALDKRLRKHDPLSSRNEAVTRAANRYQMHRLFRIDLDLSPQFRDMDINGSRFDVEASRVSPDF